MNQKKREKILRISFFFEIEKRIFLVLKGTVVNQIHAIIKMETHLKSHHGLFKHLLNNKNEYLSHSRIFN